MAKAVKKSVTKCVGCYKSIKGTIHEVAAGSVCDRCIDALLQCDRCFNFTAFDEGAVNNDPEAKDYNVYGDGVLCSECGAEEDVHGVFDDSTDQWGNPNVLSEDEVDVLEAKAGRQKVTDEQVIEGYKDAQDFIDRNGLQMTVPPQNQICGVCQRPWIDGKCSGGFVNHKL